LADLSRNDAMTRPSLAGRPPASRDTHPDLILLLAVAVVATVCFGCQRERRPVVVFAAASLTRAFSDLEAQIEQEQPGLDLRVEVSGSQDACRKVAELRRRADVVATADYKVIDKILRPSHAAFTLQFATNSVVLAHAQHSPHTEQINADNWPRILLGSDVRLGMASPDQAPIGYATLLVWQLAERHLTAEKVGADLAGRLRARCPRAHITTDESELLQLLQTRAIDYAFLYRSTAEDHNLKTVLLPDAYNLGAAERSAEYERASVRVRMRRSEALEEIRGGPILYGLTLPRDPPNPEGATDFVRLILGDAGRRTLERAGFRALSPPRCDRKAELPAKLRALVR
jgi:molybdate/tungstate transport system substrate-binding protein